ncbi:MAG: ROK family protein [Candidatus Saccharimonadales bacterium]
MYLGIDVGATKTLFAVFDPGGEMVCECKVKTATDYKDFKAQLAENIDNLKRFSFSHACCAIPGRIDFENGIGEDFGNLPWRDVTVLKDLQALLPGVKALIHNDAKLAGLSESILLHKKYSKVLYITISTGIGGGVITNDVIDKDFENFEPGQMIFEHDGKTEKWESFASGKALNERYGKLASEIEDPVVWKEYVTSLVAGFEDLLATIQPDVVIIGGGVGTHFEKFQPFLEAELNKINNPLVPIPPLLKARRPEEAVIYGCYDYIKQTQ